MSCVIELSRKTEIIVLGWSKEQKQLKCCNVQVVAGGVARCSWENKWCYESEMELQGAGVSSDVARCSWENK